MSIEKESFDFVGDPHTEGSTTAAIVAPVTAKDTEGPDSFLVEILFVVALEEPMSIESPGVFANGARRAFEEG